MAPRLIVAVTDKGWYDFLAARPQIDEVNFWSPGEQNFKALQPGELLLFKLHAPINAIVGCGVFAHSSIMPSSIAWEAFGNSNGAASLADMRKRIERYRRVSSSAEDYRIGCRILTQPVFLPRDAWLPQPTSWKPNIVSFLTFSTETVEGLALWEAFADRLQGSGGPELTRQPGFGQSQERFGPPQIVTPRLGQGAFRIAVTDAYGRKCAFSGERTLPVLQAAHIQPYAEGGQHSLSNGLLLRSDLHTLFDRGYITATPDLRIEVSRRIREEFENGRHYYELHGQSVRLPADRGAQPNPGLLQWHNERRYLG